MKLRTRKQTNNPKLLRMNRPRTNLNKARPKTTTTNNTEADESSDSEELDEQEKEE